MTSVLAQVSAAAKQSQELLIDQLADAIEAGQEVDLEQVRHQATAGGINVADIPRIVLRLTQRFERVQQYESRDFAAESRAAKKAQLKSAEQLKQAQADLDAANLAVRDAHESGRAAGLKVNAIAAEEREEHREFASFMAASAGDAVDKTDWRNISFD
ncbi:MAG: hypothetical protein GXP26_05060 [Planctomycetes bacterium]|nr:hypothetical protein [Planctomycetota bacterium]